MSILNVEIKSQTRESYINTSLGKIAVYETPSDSKELPLIFLHGVYFDHHLWDNQISEFPDRQIVTIDLPLHGNSKDKVPKNWTLDHCAFMLIEILDSLNIKQVIAIGHSWGSMTILRAAVKEPERFAAVGFCNMPFEKISFGNKIKFKLQHTALIFQNFYTKQTAKTLFAQSSLAKNPELYDRLKTSMTKLRNIEIRKTDKNVIFKAENATLLLKNLQFPAMALKGIDDYVPAAPGIETILIEGGHVSPLENTEEVNSFVRKICKLQ
jgi:pimeloyl-ACP methyl ester carboxylesterase